MSKKIDNDEKPKPIPIDTIVGFEVESIYNEKNKKYMGFKVKVLYNPIVNNVVQKNVVSASGIVIQIGRWSKPLETTNPFPNGFNDNSTDATRVIALRENEDNKHTFDLFRSLDEKILDHMKENWRYYITDKNKVENIEKKTGQTRDEFISLEIESSYTRIVSRQVKNDIDYGSTLKMRINIDKRTIKVKKFDGGVEQRDVDKTNIHLYSHKKDTPRSQPRDVIEYQQLPSGPGNVFYTIGIGKLTKLVKVHGKYFLLFYLSTLVYFDDLKKTSNYVDDGTIADFDYDYNQNKDEENDDDDDDNKKEEENDDKKEKDDGRSNSSNNDKKLTNKNDGSKELKNGEINNNDDLNSNSGNQDKKRKLENEEISSVKKFKLEEIDDYDDIIY